MKDLRFGNKKRIPCVYLLRIGVRINSQRQGIGRKLMNFMFETYPEHSLSLDVNSESDQAVNFYRKCGLMIKKVYVTPEPDNVEFATFETPLDKKGKKLDLCDPDMIIKSVQPYYDSLMSYKNNSVSNGIETDVNIILKEEEAKVEENNSNEDTNESSENVVSPAEVKEKPLEVITKQEISII